MAGVQKMQRTRFYLNDKRVSPDTPGAQRVIEFSKDYYGILFENGKRIRCRLEGITSKAKAEEKWKALLQEARSSLKKKNSRSLDLVEVLVEDYERNLCSTGIKKKTIKDEIDKVKGLLLEALQVIRLEEVDISQIQEELQNSKVNQTNRKPRPRSARTKNYYIGALVRFGKWLKENRHWKKNIFVRLKRFQKLEVKVRREMTSEELTKLIQTARTRGFRSGSKEQGQERALFYTFLFYTLTRYGSAKSVVVGQINFTQGHEEIVLRGDQVKNKKAVTKPLHPLLVKELKEWIKQKKLRPTDKLFPGIKSNLINQFNIDLEKAGIQKVLPDGTSLDIHAFKTTAISMLHDAGVPIKVIQHLAEHASANTTLSHYARANRESLDQAFLHLPKLG